MNARTFSNAMCEISDKYVTEAILYQRGRKRNGWIKWSAAAACLCLVISALIPMMRRQGQGMRDVEPRIELTLEEAAREDSFGRLFPTKILDGYILEGTAAIYDETLLLARFYNEALEDELTIRIAAREWFYNQSQDLELVPVFYIKNLNGTGSSIYIDGGDYMIQYSFSSRDIAEMEGLYDMVTSAVRFKEGIEWPDME